MMRSDFTQAGWVLQLPLAIVKVASEDYRCARRALKINPNYRPALKLKKDCENFFNGSFIGNFYDFEGSYILKKLEEEFE